MAPVNEGIQSRAFSATIRMLPQPVERRVLNTIEIPSENDMCWRLLHHIQTNEKQFPFGTIVEFINVDKQKVVLNI